MEALWFTILAMMLAVYVVLDGFDFGAAIIHRLVARNDEERMTVVRSIGPVWDANEVWLISSGALLFFAFPRVYSAAFSGFYLPLTLVLWLLVGRGLSVEWRSHLPNPLWRSLMDTAFMASGWLLAIVLGAALGNLIRGLPIEANGYFRIPLWTDFSTGPRIGALDWYTVLVAVFALLVLAGHGAIYLFWKTDGPVQARARAIALRAWVGVIVLGIALTFATAKVRPDLYPNLFVRPWSWPLVFSVFLGVVGVFTFLPAGMEKGAFLSSALFIAGMLGGAAAGIYPEILRSTVDPAFTLRARSSAASVHGLRIGLAWWCIGMPLVVFYFACIFRSFRGKVRPGTPGY